MANLNTKTLSSGVGDILCVDGGISGDKQIIDGDGTTSNLYIDGTNLGIGVSAPTYPLHVLSALDSPLFVQSTDNGCGIDLRDNVGGSGGALVCGLGISNGGGKDGLGIGLPIFLFSADKSAPNFLRPTAA